MKPEPLARTSFCFADRLAGDERRARDASRRSASAAFGRSARRMKLLLDVAAGQCCHCTSSAVIGLTEDDVGLRDQHIDGRQLRRRIFDETGAGSEPLAR